VKASDVILQLAAVLPSVSTLFSDSIAVASLSLTGSTVTAVTAGAHGLTTGDSVTITGALSPNAITSLTRVNDIATAVTTDNHDLTEGFQENVTIIGADQAAYNGDNKLLTVPNRKTFTYQVTGSPATPATGSIFLLENKRASYNGRFVITVTGATTFTYEITTTPGSPAGGSPVVHTEIRISGAATPERAVDAYTRQDLNELWAFVVVDDTEVSRDRALTNDSNVTLGVPGSNRIRLIENFSVYIITPSVSSIAGREERDLMDDVAKCIYSSLVGVVLPSNLSCDRRFIVTANGDGFFAYSGSYYIHRFTFQTVKDIVTDDIFVSADDVAFRDIQLTTLNSFDEVLTDVTANLDDEPLP